MDIRSPNGLKPYKGLMPYDEADEQFFFGREREIQIIISNLFAARLTTLYGTSGVGKSSVLRAGVVSQIRDRIRKANQAGESPDVAIVYFKEWQRDLRGEQGQGIDVLSRLKTAIGHALQEALTLDAIDTDRSSHSLSQVIKWTTDRLNGDLMIILDQFEEYFLYHPWDDQPRSFAAEFIEAVNDDRLPVSFLLAIRGDSLSTLDRFKGKIPNLFSNSLRINPLTAQAARQAIIKPLEVYNRLRPADPPMGIDEQLIDQIISDVPFGHSLVEDSAGSPSYSLVQPTNDGIETPYLQVVLERLWEEEGQKHSSKLTLIRYRELGGAKGIVKSHLDHHMDGLEEKDRHAAAAILRHLITPSGIKIAMNGKDLAHLTKIDRRRVDNILKLLSSSQIRILNPVIDDRYELFHDALAPAALKWLTRYTVEQEKKASKKRAVRYIAIVTIFLTVLSLWAITHIRSRELELQNQALELQKEALELQNQEIQLQMKSLLSKNDSQKDITAIQLDDPSAPETRFSDPRPIEKDRSAHPRAD